MAATIDFFWSIDYINKRIYYENNNPSDNDFVWSVNELYSYLQDVFDELDQMDDYTPMTAQTPTAYTLTNGWFIDDESIKFLDGGAISQANNSPDSLSILYLESSNGSWTTPFVPSDIGLPIVQAGTNDSGILLAYDNTLYKFFVRQDTTDDSFDGTADCDVTGGTGNATNDVAGAAEVSLFTNVYTLGTLATLPEPQVYIFQDDEAISEWSNLTNWDRGHIDILVKVREGGTLIDSGFITVFARQLGDLYDNFEIDLSAGGRNAVPMATATDLDNATGSYYLLVDSDSGSFSEGEIITDGTSGATAEVVSYTSLDVANTGILVLAGIKGTFGDNNIITGGTSNEIGSVNGTVGDTYFEYTNELVSSFAVSGILTGGSSGAKRVIRGVQDDTNNTGFLVTQVDATVDGNVRVPYYIDFSTGEEVTDAGTSTTADVVATSTTVVSGYSDITISFVNGEADHGGTGGGPFAENERVTWNTGSGSAILLKDSGSNVTLGNYIASGGSLSGQEITGDSSGATCTPSEDLQSANTMQKNFSGVPAAFPYDIIVECANLYSSNWSHADENSGRAIAQVYEYFKFVTREDSTFSMYTVLATVVTILDGEEYIQSQAAYTPSKASPIGTFAGGTLFGAQGVFLVGMDATDVQSFSLIDSDGTVRNPPNSQSITISSLGTNETVSVFRSDATITTEVEKDQYTVDTPGGGVNEANDTTLQIDTVIPAFTPTSGFVRIVDVSADVEYRIAYTSFDSSLQQFTLSNVIPQDLTTNDTVYIPFIDTNTATTSATVTVIYDGTGDAAFLEGGANGFVPLVIRVRKIQFLPFQTTATFGSTGTSVGAIRTADGIVTV